MSPLLLRGHLKVGGTIYLQQRSEEKVWPKLIVGVDDAEDTEPVWRSDLWMLQR